MRKEANGFFWEDLRPAGKQVVIDKLLNLQPRGKL